MGLVTHENLWQRPHWQRPHWQGPHGCPHGQRAEGQRVEGQRFASVQSRSIAAMDCRDGLPVARNELRGRARAKRPILREQVRPLRPCGNATPDPAGAFRGRDVCYGAMCSQRVLPRCGACREPAAPGVNARLHTSSAVRTGGVGGEGGSGAKPQRTRRRHRCGRPGGWRSESRLLADRL